MKHKTQREPRPEKRDLLTGAQTLVRLKRREGEGYICVPKTSNVFISHYHFYEILDLPFVA